MEQFASKLEPSGRLLIPAGLRKKLGIQPGAEMILVEDRGTLRVLTREAALRLVQGYFSGIDPGVSWVDELIGDRRRDAARDRKRR